MLYNFQEIIALNINKCYSTALVLLDSIVPYV